ncbi:hypothetical protein DLM75_06830 [Leptospira stimsonii]|uniref:Uncharacterized protein n=1 Tax=Leptospira stimsonii TaxID=2202203 RepID=A0A396ZB93_9LEPT|nr:hypothetical protein DLM75_06830 [Leptospira stimsonii]
MRLCGSSRSETRFKRIVDRIVKSKNVRVPTFLDRSRIVFFPKLDSYETYCFENGIASFKERSVSKGLESKESKDLKLADF